MSFICVSGRETRSRARDLVSSRYPGIEIVEFPHRRLRISTFRERIRLLRGFRGRALVFYFQSLDDLKYRQILECFHFLHRCQETVLCDSERPLGIDAQSRSPAIGPPSSAQHPA